MSTRALVILRHAKAANPEATADRDRPLTDRGHADAAAAGSWLNAGGLSPDLVLCSPSRRTKQTWHGVALGLSSAPRVHFDEAIYGGSVRSLLAVVRSADDDASTVLLIGHNPGLSQLSSLLGSASDAATDNEEDGLKTAGIAVHTWDGGWVDCGPGAAPRTNAHTARG
ncbi:MAG: histidine phosphatase family protein [Sporichthyaceae bacterium]|nr:histidine phosphatase family protein [Sporichthyaceae bacterium]